MPKCLAVGTHEFAIGSVAILVVEVADDRIETMLYPASEPRAMSYEHWGVDFAELLAYAEEFRRNPRQM